MSALTEYVNDIVETVTSVFEGMAITFSHLVRRPSMDPGLRRGDSPES